MPDISLLQREYEVGKEESKIPGYVSTATFSLLIILVGAYIGLYVYNQDLKENIQKQEDLIKEIGADTNSKSIEHMKSVGDIVSVLTNLRTNHVQPNNLIKKIEESTHPLVYFTSGNFDVVKNSVALSGVASSPLVMARQIELYSENTDLSDYEVSGINYTGAGKDMTFSVSLTFLKETK